MSLVRWSPFGEIDKFFKDVMDDWRPMGVWRPAVDIKEEENSIIIDAELPGMSENDIKVSVDNNILQISGERKVEKENDYHRIERYYGSFSRSFSLPSIAKTGEIEAIFDKGILSIKVPTETIEKSKRIEIKPKTPSRRSLGTKT